MDRLACVDVPALALQLLQLRHPDWLGLPIAVVDADKPQGLVLEVNAPARAGGIMPGHRYGPALSLLPTLRAAPVAPDEVQAGVRDILGRLHGFSPDVEPLAAEPGVFWLDAGGMEHLYASPEEWALALREDLRALGWIAAVVVGFRRFGSYAAAKALRGRQAVVFESEAEETDYVGRVPLRLVGLPPGTRDALAKLGVVHVADFLALPPEGVAKRFGPEAHQLHRFASGDLELPLSPVVVEAPLVEACALDWGEQNAQRLVFVIKPLVDRLLARLGERAEALVELKLALALDGATPREDHIRLAEPTLASVRVMELVRLRLEGQPPEAPVVGVAVTAGAVPATSEQLRIFAEAPKRDLAAGARAFARLRAAFGGEEVVVKAVPRDRHLPEGAFAWEPLDRLRSPQPAPEAEGTLVRRMLLEPEALPPSPLAGPDGWLVRGVVAGPVDRLAGPYRISGGWWRAEVTRDYYYAETRRGDLLWVFWDRVRRRWFLHGEIL